MVKRGSSKVDGSHVERIRERFRLGGKPRAFLAGSEALPACCLQPICESANGKRLIGAISEVNDKTVKETCIVASDARLGGDVFGTLEGF